MSKNQVDLSDADEGIVATNALLGKIYSQLVAPAGVKPASDDPTVFAWNTPCTPIAEDCLDFQKGFIPTNKDLDIKQLSADVVAAGTPTNHAEFRVEMAKAMAQARKVEVNDRWDHASTLSKLCDSLPNLDIIFGENNDQTLMTLADNTDSLSQTYRQLLDELQIADIPASEDSKAQLAKIEKLLFEPEAEPPGAPAPGAAPDPFGDMLAEIMGAGEPEPMITVKGLPRPSQLVRVYEEMRSQYEDAIEEFASKVSQSRESAESRDQFSRFGAMYRRRVESALRAWRSTGRKNEVEGLQSMMSHLTRGNMATFVENARLRYDTDESAALGQRDPFKFTTLVGSDTMQLPWQTVSFDQSDIHHHREKIKSSASGRFGFSQGFWGMTGKGGTSKETVDNSMDMSSLKISFEVTAARISRPWFTPEIFESPFWRLPAGQLLSDGKSVPTGRLRGYTDAVIFVKGLTIEHKKLHSFYERSKESSGGGGGLRIGPFAFGGGASESSDEADFGFNKERTGIAMAGPAIVGWRCRRLGLCPQPDPQVERWR